MRGFLLVLVALLAGCGPDAASPGAPPSTVAGARATPGPTPTNVLGEVRRATLSVPAGMRLASVQFGDAAHGYALVLSATPVRAVPGKGEVDGTGRASIDVFRTLLFATADGGRRWTPVRLPRPDLAEPWLQVIGPDVLLVDASTEGRYISGDGGRTFRRDTTDEPMPAEIDRALPGYLYASDYRLMEHAWGGGSRAVPGPDGALPVPPETATLGPGGAWWAFSLNAGGIQAAVSADRGATWRARPVPAHPALEGHAPERPMAFASADGADAWLLAFPPDRLLAGSGRVAAPTRRAKAVAPPVAWLLRGDRWVPQMAAGKPSGPPVAAYSWAPAGGGLLALAGAHGLALVGDAWTPVPFPTAVGWVLPLAGGGLVAGPLDPPGPLYVGGRNGRRFTWVRVEVTLSVHRG